MDFLAHSERARAPNLDLSAIGERVLRHENQRRHMPGKNGRDPHRLRAKHWGVFRRAQDLDSAFSYAAPPVRRLLESEVVGGMACIDQQHALGKRSRIPIHLDLQWTDW